MKSSINENGYKDIINELESDIGNLYGVKIISNGKVDKYGNKNSKASLLNYYEIEIIVRDEIQINNKKSFINCILKSEIFRVTPDKSLVSSNDYYYDEDDEYVPVVHFTFRFKSEM